jgi:hypothetical protein
MDGRDEKENANQLMNLQTSFYIIGEKYLRLALKRTSDIFAIFLITTCMPFNYESHHLMNQIICSSF